MVNKIVVFETSMGNFELELFCDKMPITTENFLYLVEEGCYTGMRFHRVIKDFMVQGGDPLSKNDKIRNRWGTGGTEPIQDEFVSGLSNTRGTISMANAGPQTGSSQFFLNVADNEYLDFDKKPFNSKHPVFGKIVSGMEVVDEISEVRSDSMDRPKENITVLKAYIKN